MIVRVLFYFLELLSLLAFEFSKNLILPMNLSLSACCSSLFFFFLTGERRENKEMRQVEITSVKFLWGFLLGFFFA